MAAWNWYFSDVSPERFHRPERQQGIWPFWFLNGELDAEEMIYQLEQFRDQGVPGVILHARYGLEMPYAGEKYIERIELAIREANRLGLKTMVYDEMNWPSGTADGNVLKERPDLSQRYLECIVANIRGPYFNYLTGADSRYMDFERSVPVAAFAIGEDGSVIDLTPNLSFTNVIPWQAPEGSWRVLYIVEKRADYYIDALNPEATEQFIRLGYEPYTKAIKGAESDGAMLGFYTDEPAMHYFLTAMDNNVIPWSKDMFRRFRDRNGYDLRPRLPDLFVDVNADSARVRYDYYTTLTEFYSDSYYRQIHEWCQQRGLIFTGHLLFEEWLRRLVRVEGNLFKHYEHMDVVGVDHLYPIIGDVDRPEEHVAIKVASSGAHHNQSPRLLCESFGGIFMDATMQRMKWITDWEYVLGVNMLNPHGFHYTFEGPRKRDWPPSMFYQTPWWHYYEGFSDYTSRLSDLLSGGSHVAKVAVLWPINAVFATYIPQHHSQLGDRTEQDFAALTDMLLRLHHDFDYVEEDVLAEASIQGSGLQVGDEVYDLIILPPMTHIKLATMDKIEAFVEQGGRVVGGVFLPTAAYDDKGIVDISERMSTAFGVDAQEALATFDRCDKMDVVYRDHPTGGKTAFFRSYAISRRVPTDVLRQAGGRLRPESPYWVNESREGAPKYLWAPPDTSPKDITALVLADRQQVADVWSGLLSELIQPDVTIDNRELFYLHRRKEERDIYFVINPTHSGQKAHMSLQGAVQPVLWDPSTGVRRPIVPSWVEDGRTHFELTLAPVGSAFVLTDPAPAVGVVETNVIIDHADAQSVSGYGSVQDPYIVVQESGGKRKIQAPALKPLAKMVLNGAWEFQAEDDNALVLSQWLATDDQARPEQQADIIAGAQGVNWLSMVPGAWSYQLPAEPQRGYPLDVWYKATFVADWVPERMGLVIDGFAGADWSLYLNGQHLTAKPVRSAFDAQMQEVDIAQQVRLGRNELVIRLKVTDATDGLLDPLKLVGSFALAGQDGHYRIAEPAGSAEPASWTRQGYPFYSGRGVYRTSFELPGEFEGQRVFLEPEMDDDVLDVTVNGQHAGTRLWAPYSIEISALLQAGQNEIALLVANTPINLLEAVQRDSGLTSAPCLVAMSSVRFDLD